MHSNMFLKIQIDKLCDNFLSQFGALRFVGDADDATVLESLDL